MSYSGLQGKPQERTRDTKEEDLNSEDIFCFESNNCVKFNIIMDIDNIVLQFNKLSIEERVSALEKMQISLEEARKAQEPQKPKWADRASGREVTPVDFIKTHYGRWDGDQWSPDGLTRADLRRADLDLYNAYVARIRHHPKEDLGLETQKRKEITDPSAYLEKKRASQRIAWHQRYKLTAP